MSRSVHLRVEASGIHRSQPRGRPIYRTEYEMLGRQQAFEDESVELLDGQIVYASEEGPPHADVAARLARLAFEGSPPARVWSVSATPHRAAFAVDVAVLLR